MKLDPIRTGVLMLAVGMVFALGVAVASSSSARHPDTHNPTGEGRYQISRPADARDHYDNGANWVVLLDTITGDAWRLEVRKVDNRWQTGWVKLPDRLPDPPESKSGNCG